MAYVYWIRHVSHTDMFSEGYIGVTSKTPEERFAEHRAIARQPKNRNKFTLHKALNKYPPEEIVVQAVVKCEIDYAYDLELKLRPERAIGWNTSVGGYAGVYKGRCGFKQSPEWIEKIKEINSNPTPETRQRKREGQARRYQVKDETGWSDNMEYLKKLRVLWETDGAPWRNPKIKLGALHEVYNRADEIHKFTMDREFRVTADSMQVFLGCVGIHKGPVKRILGMIWSGWNPLEDSQWVKDFRDGFFKENGYLESNASTQTRRNASDKKAKEKYEVYLAEQRKDSNDT